MKLEKLKDYIGKMPLRPGIYIFKGPLGQKLYVGKAAKLRGRLWSYLRTPDRRIRTMVEKAAAIDFVETHSDIEAIILESQSIKKWRPEFNIVMRDDKQYFYVGFTDEIYPKLELTHQPNASPGISYAGPFTDGTAIKTALRLLRRIFPYCTCKQKHNVPCLNFHIGKCPGFCCLKNPGNEASPKEYSKNVSAIKSILQGKRESVLKRLEKEMRTLAKDTELEKALILRNKIDKLKRVFENARIIQDSKFQLGAPEESKKNVLLAELQLTLQLPTLPTRIEGFDVANIQGQYGTGAMVVFENGIPNKNEYRRFRIKYNINMINDTAMLKEVLQRRLSHPEWSLPDLILVDGGKGQVNAVKHILKLSKKTIPIVGLTKNEFHRGDHLFINDKKEPVSLKELPRSVNNLLLFIDTEAHRFAISYYRKRHGKSIP